MTRLAALRRTAASLRLSLLLGLVVAVGATAAAASWWQALRQPAQPPLASLAAVVVLVATGDVALLRIRYGAHGNSFTWAEASLIAGAVFVDWSWLIALGSATVLVRQLGTGRGLRKAAFNAGGFASGAVLGRLGYLAVTGSWHVPPNVGWRQAVGLVVAAALVYFAWISVTVALVVAWSQGSRFVTVWRKGSTLRLVMFLGNSAAGLGVVLVGHYTVRSVATLGFFVGVLYLSYNSYLRAQQERDTWQALQQAATDLNRVEPRAVAAAAARGASAIFGADRTLLLLGDDPVAVAAATPELRARGRTSSAAPVVLEPAHLTAALRRELAALDVSAAVLAPLDGVEGRLGVMVLGFQGPVRMRRRELRVFSTYAGQVASSIQQSRLFAEMGAQRSRLAGIVDHASDGILVVGADGSVLAWNPAMARLAGRPESAALGRRLEDVLDAALPGDAPLDFAALCPQGVDGGPRCLEIRLRVADDDVRDLELSVSTVPSPAGACEYAVVLARDITAARELEQAKQDFVATVSHELRTPLTPLKGWLSILLRRDFAPGEDQLRQIHAQMLDQTRSLERLVEDLLSVSRMERGHFDVTAAVVDVDAVVARAVDDFGHGSDRVIHRLPGGPDSRALADPARLQQVVANLLSNADKYSPRLAPVEVTVASVDAGVRVTVRDHGSGIPASSRETIFEPFRRLGEHLTRETRGTGLGLHIARELIDAMGGRIWVEGAEGGGALFGLVVPAAPELPAQSSPHGRRVPTSH